MNRSDAMLPEADALRERISRLCAAILRIGGSLDIDTVLRAAVEEARALTGARFGAVATTDESGMPAEYVTSGLTEEQSEGLVNWSGGPLLFMHLRDLEAPLRTADMPAYARSRGWTTESIPCESFQGTTMCRGDVHIGSLFVAGKEGDDGEQEFTPADEEMLVLFASQAATAIANARTHREERRSRADLEALVETSPVGVVVFDTQNCQPRWVNQEAHRLIAGLKVPDLDIAQLLGVLTIRRGDGQTVALSQIDRVDTLRAEEVELSAPSGQSIRTLMSATPSRSPADDALVMVVTMQDLEPFEELERSRAEFLGMVSHELRAPLAAIKGSAATVLGATRAFDSAEMRQFFRIVDGEADRMDELIGDLLDMGRIETGTLSVDPVPTQVSALLDQARSTFLTANGRHAVQVDLPSDVPRVAADERRILQVLNNLVANAARRSPVSAPIRMAASHNEGFVELSVTNGGEGIPDAELPHLFGKHAAVQDGKSRGTGLGLAICRGIVEAHGGRIRAESGEAGAGTRFAFTLPVAQGNRYLDEQVEAIQPGPSPTTPARATVLVVDDDPHITRFVRDVLAEAGYTPVITGVPDDVPHLVRQHEPDLVLLDLILPHTDGIELMRECAELGDRPVIFISAYGRDETIARALEAGACDYIVKPFSPTELTARVRAALRGRIKLWPFLLGDLVIDYERRVVSVAGRPVPLTATEYELLRVLAASADRVMTYDALVRRVWGWREAGSPNLVRTFVKKLRRKLGDQASTPKYIVNERGVGYRMAGPGKG